MNYFLNDFLVNNIRARVRTCDSGEIGYMEVDLSSTCSNAISHRSYRGPQGLASLKSRTKSSLKASLFIAHLCLSDVHPPQLINRAPPQ